MSEVIDRMVFAMKTMVGHEYEDVARAALEAITRAGYRLHRDHSYKRIIAIGGNYEECERCGQVCPGLADNSSCPKAP